MAELADALDSKSSYGDIVWVRFPPAAFLSVKCCFLKIKTTLFLFVLYTVFISFLYLLLWQEKLFLTHSLKESRSWYHPHIPERCNYLIDTTHLLLLINFRESIFDERRTIFFFYQILQLYSLDNDIMMYLEVFLCSLMIITQK